LLKVVDQKEWNTIYIVSLTRYKLR